MHSNNNTMVFLKKYVGYEKTVTKHSVKEDKICLFVWDQLNFLLS